MNEEHVCTTVADHETATYEPSQDPVVAQLKINRLQVQTHIWEFPKIWDFNVPCYKDPQNKVPLSFGNSHVSSTPRTVEAKSP